MNDIKTKNQNKTKNKNILYKTAVILSFGFCFAMIILMLVLAAVYISRANFIKKNPEENIQINNLLILRENESVKITDYDKTHILPEFIGLKFGLTNTGLVSNFDLMNDLYSACGEYINYIFSNSNVRVSYDSDKGSSVWKDCFSKDNYIYIKYHESIPSYIIQMFLSEDKDKTNDNINMSDITNVCDMFIFFNYYDEEFYNINALVRDGAGNVYSYNYNYKKPNEIKHFEINNILIYTNSKDFVKYNYAYKSNISADILLNLDPASIIYTKNIYTRDFSYQKSFEGLISGEALVFFLKLFSFNPDKLSAYTENNGTEVYIENHGIIRVLPDSTLIYSAIENGGIDISSFLNYTNYERKYSINEIVLVSDIITSTIYEYDRSLLGYDGKPQLTNIYYEDDGSLVIKYDYFYDNVLILNEEYVPVTACKYIFSESGILNKIYINTQNISGESGNNKIVNLPQLWFMRHSGLYNTTENWQSYFDIRLAYIINSNKPGVFGTEWINVTKYKNE